MGWSFSIGRYAGIDVRVHLLFVVFVVFKLLDADGGLAFAARWLAMLFVFVLLHEFGHCIAARRVGGTADEILMWPLGGLALVNAPRTPLAQFATVAGGPLVNVIALAVLAPTLVLLGGTIRAVPWNPFDPWSGAVYLDPFWIKTIYTAYVVNFVLLVFNVCLPMYPFDGGRILQTVLWRYVGFGRSMRISTTVGMVGAIVLGLIGLLRQQYLLLAIAVFGYFSCLQERRLLAMELIEDEGVIPYGRDAGYGGPRGRRGGLFGWWHERRQKAAARRSAEEQTRMRREDEEVDRILMKVHREGIQSLTRAERKTLESATRRHQQSHLNGKL